MKNLTKNYLLDSFGDFDIRSLTYQDINIWIVNNSKPHRQVIKAAEVLRSCLRWTTTVLVGYTAPNFPKLPKSKMRTTYIDEETLNLILDKVEKHKEVIQTAVLYAMRPCEVRALKWKDLDWKKNTITIQRHFSGTKLLDGRKSASKTDDRYYKLTFEMLSEFQEIAKSLPRSLNPDDYIFRVGSKPVGANSLRASWNQAVKAAGLFNIPMYEGTRHARATHLYQMGVPKDVVRELLGQTDMRTTDRYAKANPVALSKLFEESSNLRISCAFKKVREKE